MAYHGHQDTAEREDKTPKIPAGGGLASQYPDPTTHTTEQATAAPGTDRNQRQRNPPRDNGHT